MTPPISREELQALAHAAGFSRLGVAGVDLAQDEARLQQWLARGYHGQMEYMERHGTRRSRPDRKPNPSPPDLRHQLLLCVTT